MKNRKIGTLTLATTLILLGTLFLANNFITIGIFNLLKFIWPIILIFFGFEIILSNYLYRKHKDNQKLSISISSIVIILLIIMSIFVTYNISLLFPKDFYISNIDDFVSYISKGYLYEYTYTDSLETDIKDGSKFYVKNSFGNIDIKNGDTDKILIEANYLIRNNDEEYAKSIVKNLLDIKHVNSNVFLTSNRDKYDELNKIYDIRIDLYITVPKNIDTDILNKFGEIYGSNITNNISISNKHGSIELRSVNGSVDTQNSHGDISINDVSGAVNVINNHGNVTASNINNNLDITNTFGTVKVENINGGVEIYNEHESINIANIKGNVNLDSKFSNISIDDISGNVSVNGNNGDISFKAVTGNVKCTNKFGDIEIINCNKSIKVTNNNGNIIVENNELITDKLDIINEFGNINVVLNRTQLGTFDLSSKHGNIKTNMDLVIDKKVNEEFLKENIGDSNVLFYITNNSGDISIIHR